MLQETARARGIELSIHRIAKAEEIAGAIEAANREGAEALNVLASPLLFINRRTILPLVATFRLPPSMNGRKSLTRVAYLPTVRASCRFIGTLLQD